jgi:hypothetical protein
MIAVQLFDTHLANSNLFNVVVVFALHERYIARCKSIAIQFLSPVIYQKDAIYEKILISLPNGSLDHA